MNTFTEFSSDSRVMARPKWRKLLYIHQDYPDNYVDSSFLKLMKRNVNVRPLNYWNVVSESLRVSQQISVEVIFVAMFIHLYMHSWISPVVLIVGSCTVSACLYILWYIMLLRFANSDYNPSDSPVPKTVSSVVLFFTMLLGLTPILKNLTKDISSDSIWFMTIMMLLANLLFHDYGSGSSTHARFPDSLSINAAMFASVLLASRLSSNMSVFGLMLLAVQLFALFPILCRSLREWYHPSTTWDSIMTVILIGFAVALMWHISHMSIVLYMVSMILVTFMGPYLLVFAQRYKSEIRGPWDEAVINPGGR
ncbi:glycosylphosphatidylinositol anchor biosynthesis [Batrachochytrium dendrobatidis]|nr:glycosylphosphatidylinositol anchor biosynthesis [Batrachochytrium dendrobatidis]